MEAGHTYKLSLYDIENFKIDGFDTKGKNVLEMEDQYEYADGMKRKSYLVIDGKNNGEEIQSRILNTGNVIAHPETKSSQKVIQETTENALRDKARVEKSSWFTVNSDKGYKSFETYLGILDEFREGFKEAGSGNLYEKENIVNSIKSFSSMSQSDKEQLRRVVPSLFSNKPGSELNIVQERAINFLYLYDDLNQKQF
jgi:hypothetical protein